MKRQGLAMWIALSYKALISLELTMIPLFSLPSTGITVVNQHNLVITSLADSIDELTINSKIPFT